MTEEINFSYGASTAPADDFELRYFSLPASGGEFSQVIVGEGTLTDGNVATIATYLKSIDYNATQVL